MPDSLDDYIEPTPMPTAKQNPCIEEHKYATRAQEAHPIRSVPEIILHFPLSAIQAVAVKETPEDWIPVLETEDLVYYRVTSPSFYGLLRQASEDYETKIEVEQVQTIVDLHTRQFLQDVHGFTDVDELPRVTLCDAMNHSQDDSVSFEDVPREHGYGYVDARGLIVQKDTHLTYSHRS